MTQFPKHYIVATIRDCLNDDNDDAVHEYMTINIYINFFVVVV